MTSTKVSSVAWYSVVGARCASTALIQYEIDTHLIDLAQRLNPSTRIAWGEAQQAAQAAGMVESTYRPLISASVVGGYMRSDRDSSVHILGREVDVDYDTHLSGAVPSLTLKWLLFDFGKRAALLEAADKLAMARPDAMIMHPGPMNRGVEITDEVADGPQSLILTQVRNGVAARMAVLEALLRR